MAAAAELHFVEPALAVADEREKPVRPSEAAPIAELAEQIGADEKSRVRDEEHVAYRVVLLLVELGADAQSKIYEKSSIDLAMKDAFRKMRHFLMTTKGLSEDEAISLMSVAVDFGVTQVVDGNWGVHAIIKKSLFAGA